jgi:hypothetical protein
MRKEFKNIKKDGYGILHVDKIGAFIVMPLKAGCDLAKIGKEAHMKKKTTKKR